jgi:geranylgeranyl diphosphate synthase type II
MPAVEVPSIAASSDPLIALELVRAFIDPRLAASLPPAPDASPRLLEAMRYALLAPGKRLRPALVLWSAGAVAPTGMPPEAAWEAATPAAIAIEMIHAYSLVHDDLPAMDDDDLRRGRPTCHRAFDEATAILCGDALQALAFSTLVAGMPTATANRAALVLARASGPEALVGGQADDLAVERGWQPDLSTAPPSEQLGWLERVHRRKTGELFRAAVALGGLAVEAGDGQLALLDTYARNFGLAFQIADDLLDAEGDEATVGKRVGKDAERGKLTFPSVAGREESRRRAGDLAASARSATDAIGPAAEPLGRLAGWIVSRDH